jgi:hypothetical protein
MGAISLEVQQAEILRSLVMVALGMMAMMGDDGSFLLDPLMGVSIFKLIIIETRETEAN